MDESRSLSGFLHHAKGWFIAFVAMACSIAVWFYFHDVPPLGDSGAFVGLAEHMLQGKVLYKDFFDNKAPGIFFINLAFLKLTGNSPWSLHLMQLAHLMAACCCILWLWNRSGLKAWWLALLLLPWILLRFTHWPYYFSAGYTEEYAIYYLLFAIWLITESDLNRQRWIYLIPAGMALGFSLLIRETFIFNAGIVFLWAVLSSEKRLLTMLQLLLGALVPSGLFLFYLINNDALQDYLNYLHFAGGYAATQPLHQALIQRINAFISDWKQVDVKVLAFAAASLTLLADGEFMVQTRFLPLLFPALIIGSALPLGLGPQAYGHYYLPLLFFCLMSGMGFMIWSFEKLYWISHIASLHRLTNVLIPVAGIWLMYTDIDFAGNHFLKGRFNAGSEETERQLVRKKTKGFKTFATDAQDLGRFYFYTGNISALYHPCPYYVYYQEETAGKQKDEMCNRLRNSFLQNKPECIATAAQPGYGTTYCALTDSLHSNYTIYDSMTTSEDKKVLFRLRNDLLEGWLEKRRRR